MSENLSHGRGGVGNIGPDKNKYVDGEIVRAGPEGDQGDGPFSTGRGGGGNIGARNSPKLQPADKDVIPVQAQRIEKLESHHYGRGGAGNEAHVHEKKDKKKEKHHGHEGGKEEEEEEGLADRILHKITGHGHEHK